MSNVEMCPLMTSSYFANNMYKFVVSFVFADDIAHLLTQCCLYLDSIHADITKIDSSSKVTNVFNIVSDIHEVYQIITSNHKGIFSKQKYAKPTMRLAHG